MSAMSSPFGIGDTVRLKSGGPVMVVEAVEDSTKRVTAIWWDAGAVAPGIDNTGIRRAIFNPSTLRNAEPDMIVEIKK